MMRRQQVAGLALLGAVAVALFTVGPAGGEPAAPSSPTAAAGPLELGDHVPADQVAQARDDGEAVYVSPRFYGAGIVASSGIVPDEARTDVAAIPTDFSGGPRAQAELLEDVADVINALDAIDASAVFLVPTGAFWGGDGGFVPSGVAVVASPHLTGVPELYDVPKAEALAALAPYVAEHPATVIFDLPADR